MATIDVCLQPANQRRNHPANADLKFFFSYKTIYKNLVIQYKKKKRFHAPYT